MIYSIKSMLAVTQDAGAISYIINTRHKYLIYKEGRDIKIVMSVKDVLGMTCDPDTVTVDLYDYSVFIDLRTGDLLGAENDDDLFDLEITDDTVFTSPLEAKEERFKLIFSPQLAKWLVRHKYIIWDLKPNRDGGTVFVFRIDEDFDYWVNQFKNKKGVR